MWTAIIIFVIAYIAIASEKFPRQWISLLGGSLLVVFGVLSLSDVAGYINWETLGLLAGMFILVSILTEAGFFTWLAMAAVRKVHYHPVYLFIILILMAAFLSMFMDSITVLLFLSALTVQLCRLLRIDPTPLAIAEVCAANTGGAATLVGDPPNVILGTTLGFGFSDFAAHTGPIALAAALLLVVYFYLINRKTLKTAREALDDWAIQNIEMLYQEPVAGRINRVGLICFLCAVLLLIFHMPLHHLTGLPITTATAALIPAGIALILLKEDQRRSVLSRVDGASLLFFAGLFILIGGLEKVRLFEVMADGLAKLTQANPQGLILALHWGPGLLSGVVDNVPLALAMSYVLKDLALIKGTPALSWMVWALALGVDIGGNLTPIGASANVVAYAYLEKHNGPIGWKKWLKLAVIPTILEMILVSCLLMLSGKLGWY
jgi:Na+/H+ antiporter NhaD and related arsenite permeases